MRRQVMRRRVTSPDVNTGRTLERGPLRKMHPLRLPSPGTGGGTSVMRALERRKTTRDISGRKFPLRLLSELLWAANGVNRRKGPFGLPGRTAASASNSQEIDVYVAVDEGVYLYDPIGHSLVPVLARDIRPLAISRTQSRMMDAPPVQLLYVADVDRLSHTAGYQEPGLQDPEVQKSYYYVDTGLIAGNVYLFGASRGLAVWFHNCDRNAIARVLNLRTGQRVLFGQTVGYPGRKKRTDV